MKKLILIFIISVLILSACAGADDPISDNTVTTTNTGQIETTRNDVDDLGAFDFGGEVFSMITRDNPNYFSPINIAEEIGEVLNDAVYHRARNVEERFNFVFNEVMGSGDINTVRANIVSTILAGGNEYDLVTLHVSTSMALAQEGIAHTISALPYINLEKDYWFEDINQSLSIGNYRYFNVGAHDISAYDFTHMLLFNKNMTADLGLGNLYSLVTAGEWTYDKFEELAKTAIMDLNGDGAFTNADSYGLVSIPKQVLPSFWISAGVKSIEKDSDDIPYSAMDSSKFNDVFNRIFEITWDTNIWYRSSSNDVEAMFRNNQSLFMNTSAYLLNNLRNMELDFGILPYPKYTLDQEKYLSRIEGVSCSLIPISATEEMLERTSVILEALASESLKTVVPAYYDVALKVRNTRDVESEEILDLIFAGRVFDLGDALWTSNIRDGIFAPMFTNNDRNLASKLESFREIVNNQVDIAITAFDSNLAK